MKTRVLAVGLIAVGSLLAGVAAARAEDKFVPIDHLPPRNKLEVNADGSRVYVASSEFLVFDAEGKLVTKIGYPTWGTGANDLYPLPDGWFIRCITGLGGHLALCRPDGSEAKVIVNKGDMGSMSANAGEKFLRHDMTGWSSPTGAAVDPVRKIVFAADTTIPPNDARHLPSPDWSRIGKWDFDGNYLGDINRYDAYAANAKDNDARRLWYRDLEVDPKLQRLYVTTDRGDLLVFGYDGKLLKQCKPATGAGMLAVFPDGRIANGNGGAVELFDPDLKPLKSIKLPPEIQGGITDIEADGAGRLYATVNDPAIIYVRWTADLEKADTFVLKHLRVHAEFPAEPQPIGQAFAIKVRVTGLPPPAGDKWQVMARPTDGSNLAWQPLTATLKDGQLDVLPRPEFNGFYEVVVRYGDGPIMWNNRQEDPYVQRTLFFLPKTPERSLAVIPVSGRRSYRQGESIPLLLVRRDAARTPTNVQVKLERPGLELPAVAFPVETDTAIEIPAEVTRRLAPGTYSLRPSADAFTCYALALDIAPAEADSPMQRIMYHEFGQAPVVQSLQDTAERVAFIRDYARAANRLGFTRETDRAIQNMINGTGTWRRDWSPVPITSLAQAPAEYYAIPGNGPWEIEYFNDQAVKYGLRRDSTILGHCSSIRFRDIYLTKLDFALQQFVQYQRRWPSFYGVNYNDECFFMNIYDPTWTKDDTAWLEKVKAERFKGRPGMADAYRVALRTMYDSFNTAVREADPAARMTAAPMWQFPAVEGSYAPEIYKDMSESYSHFLSEGMHIPWYPAHSVEFLRRPGLPLMGVFDNGYSGAGGDCFMKNAMQVLARGVQGVGVQHTSALASTDVADADPQGADAYRTVNLLAAMYGAVFAEAEPANEAMVLYSYEQDITQKRNQLGTPHWEEVYALLAAGLMGGVPMSIVYEEDIAAGYLMAGKTPRVPMLFLVGQTQPLPKPVMKAIHQFVKAGGRVFTDAESAKFPDATKLNLKTSGVLGPLKENYCVDSWFSELQPVLAGLATELRAAVGAYRRFPLDTDDLWVSKNSFDGGAIRYVMLANETAPYPWDAGTVWSMGLWYNKTFLPKTVTLTMPDRGGVIYDVFEHTLVPVSGDGTTVKVTADLKHFPGRLYALAPAELGAPRVEATVAGATVTCRVTAVDKAGKSLAARVPLHIRLSSGAAEVLSQYRGTDAAGSWSGDIVLPLGAAACKLEVTELLGGAMTVAECASVPPAGPAVVKSASVVAQRSDRLEALLRDAKTRGAVSLLTSEASPLTPHEVADLAAAFRLHGIELKTSAATPAEPKAATPTAAPTTPAPAETPAIFLAAGTAKDGNKTEPLLAAVIGHGLLDYAVSSLVPGTGCGLYSAVYAPRAYGENGFVLLGGDAFGLARTVDVFVDWLRTAQPATATPAKATGAGLAVSGKPAGTETLARLSEMTGVRLGNVTVAADGKRLLVAATGYMKNLALIEDGAQPKVLRTVRVAQTPTLDSLCIAPDGSFFGASGGVPERCGETFSLVDAASGNATTFAAFGVYGGFRHQFAVSATGDTVVAPGMYGVVCWKRDADGKSWKEAWSIDYWKEYNKLTWHVTADFMRIPQFHACIPRGADYALIVFGELTNNGWVTQMHHCSAYVAAVDLATGRERWRFNVPIPDTQLFPTLITSGDGARLLLKVQLGSWGKETYRFFALRSEDGSVEGDWETKSTPEEIRVADSTGNVVELHKGRLLIMRQRTGGLIYNKLWDGAAPVSIAFAPDGQGLFVADDAGYLTRLNPAGAAAWSVDAGGIVNLASAGGTVYAAGWNGRLRAFDANGHVRWTLDCNPVFDVEKPMETLAAMKPPPGSVIEVRRESTVSTAVPAGENLLAGCAPGEEEVKDKNGKVTGKIKIASNARATVKVGGTSGWLSRGLVTVTPEQLTNGKPDDVEMPWIPSGDVSNDAGAGRQAWVEIAFKAPTDVKAVTVFENKNHPDSWPQEGQVQYWDEPGQKWVTAIHSVFMSSAVNTYEVNLKQVSKIRYVPWHSYWRNFYTSEIEVR